MFGDLLTSFNRRDSPIQESNHELRSTVSTNATSTGIIPISIPENVAKRIEQRRASRIMQRRPSALHHIQRHRHNLYHHLNTRCYNTPSDAMHYQECHAVSALHLPFILREQELNTHSLDKIFTAKWLNDDEVIFGSKSNKLTLMNFNTKRRFHIPLIEYHGASKRTKQRNNSQDYLRNEDEDDNTSSSDDENNTKFLSLSHTESRDDFDNSNIFIPIRNNSFVAESRSHTSSIPSLARSNLNFTNVMPIIPFTGFFPLAGPPPVSMSFPSAPVVEDDLSTRLMQAMEGRTQTCGLHSIAINPSGTLLATGAAHPNHIAVYILPSFEPLALCIGHVDWIFGLAWLTDDVFSSGSRDYSVAFWNLKDLDKTKKGANILHPYAFRFEHKNKVRDVCVNRQQQELATLSVDTSVKLWDTTHLQVKQTLPMTQQHETVCMAVSTCINPLYAIGSQTQVSLMDTRNASYLVDSIPSLDEGWGVRSLSFNEYILTVGGGYGRLAFYDMRAKKYLNVHPTTPAADDSWHIHYSVGDAQKHRSYLETSDGWLHHDLIFEQHFHGINVRNAIYTHAYNPSRTQLFVAGGPLQLGLYGSYAALWS